MAYVVCCCSHVRSLSVSLSVCLSTRAAAPLRNINPLLLYSLLFCPLRRASRPMIQPSIFHIEHLPAGARPSLVVSRTAPTRHGIHPTPLHPPPCKVRYNRIVTRTPTRPADSRAPWTTCPVAGSMGAGGEGGGEGRGGGERRVGLCRDHVSRQVRRCVPHDQKSFQKLHTSLRLRIVVPPPPPTHSRHLIRERKQAEPRAAFSPKLSRRPSVCV